MKVLVTGAFGFLGKYVIQKFENAEITTVSRNKNSTLNIDLRQPFELNVGFDLVIHIAGKAHSIPKSKDEIQDFFKINLDGTKNLINALSINPPKRFVFISSVAVYGDKKSNYSEIDDLEGDTPYAKSKIQAESLLTNWASINNVELLVLRLPLICGKNPPGNLSLLARIIKKGYYFRIGKGLSRKSMVGAQDVADLIFENKWKQGIFNLTDGIHPYVKDTEDYIARLHQRRIYSMPPMLASLLSKFGDRFSWFPLNSNRINKLTSSLTFNDYKARKELKWNPRPALNQLSFEED